MLINADIRANLNSHFSVVINKLQDTLPDFWHNDGAMTIDLRTISAGERKALRVRAVGAVHECGNISKVSRDLDINRQVLHRWLSEEGSNEDQTGRPKQKLYDAQVRQICEILAHNLPDDLGIDDIFWSVSSVQELISKTFSMDVAAYLVRRWLLDWGLFWGRETDLFEESSVASKDVPVWKFAELCNWPCYVFWSSSAGTSKKSYDFRCVSSKRGDIRFVGEKCESVGQTSAFLNRLQEIAKRNIVVVYGKSSSIGHWDVCTMSDRVILFQKSQDTLKVLSSSKSRTEKEMFAFLES